MFRLCADWRCLSPWRATGARPFPYIACPFHCTRSQHWPCAVASSGHLEARLPSIEFGGSTSFHWIHLMRTFSKSDAVTCASHAEVHCGNPLKDSPPPPPQRPMLASNHEVYVGSHHPGKATPVLIFVFQSPTWLKLCWHAEREGLQMDVFEACNE